MKTMSCYQLGGACDLQFHAESFEEMAKLSKQHGIEMFHKNDPVHLAAMKDMRRLMQKPEAMSKWFEGKRQEFAALPEN